MAIIIIFLLSVLIIFGIYFFYIQKKYITKIQELNRENKDFEKQLKENYHKIYNLEQKIQEYEVFVRLVKQSPNAIMLMNNNGDILWINEGFVHMYEYNFYEFIKTLGKNYRQTSFSPNVEERIQFIQKYKRPFRYEALNITKNGKKLWTQTALVPVMNENSEITHMVTIDTDIHQRINKSDTLIQEIEKLLNTIDQLEERFKQLNHELSQMYNEIDNMYHLMQLTDEIMNFIKEIAEQTKILGINASIEAYAAGNFGKGFRIIANEIVMVSHKIIEKIDTINSIFNQLKKQQQIVLHRKKSSQQQMLEHIDTFAKTKQLLSLLENSVVEFKSMY